MAKGRGGGGGGSGAIDDGWDAPGEVKASLAFQIIWCIVTLFLFVAILLRLRFVPSGRYTRAPYILLSIIAGTLSIAYLFSAILTRIPGSSTNVSFSALHGLDATSSILWDIDYAFGPAVCLWLVHLRGRLTSKNQGKAAKPWVSHFWKRIIDWSLVAITFTIAVSMTAILTNAWIMYRERRLQTMQLIDYLLLGRKLNFAAAAFNMFLAVNVVVSFISLKVSQKKANFVDPITTRLLVAVMPFVIIGFVKSMVITVYPERHPLTESTVYGFNLAFLIIDGLCKVGVIGGLLSTMTISNALWVSGGAVGEGAGYVPQQSQHSIPQPPTAQWQGSPSTPSDPEKSGKYS